MGRRGMRAAAWALAAVGTAATALGASSRTGGRPIVGEPAQPVAAHACTVDLNVTGDMVDILSNALVLGLDVPESRVAAFLSRAETRYADGPALLRAAAAHFGLEEGVLRAEVGEFEHCNCGLEAGEDGVAAVDGRGGYEHVEASAFARDVTLHVVLHEIGHALVREFDLPILGNEETVADAFATYYLATFMPDRAVAVLTARVTSLMIEAAEEPADDWRGEHDHDGRRAFKIAAIAVAADAARYAPVAAVVGMSADDIRDATDYGGEVHRSWRRVLGPLWMPAGQTSGEARVDWDESSPFIASVCAGGLADEVRAVLVRFDWHSRVTVEFVDDEGGAGWSRSSRTVTVHSEYVHRFVEQGERGLAPRR